MRWTAAVATLASLAGASGCARASAPPRPVADARARPATPPAATPRAATVTPARRGAVGRIVRLRSAPFDARPEVWVRAPAGFDPDGPLNVVIYLHGWNSCLAVVAAADNAPCRPGGPVRFAMDVEAQFDRAGVNALLVVPQLAFDAATVAPGRLGEPGGLRALLAELLTHPDVAPLLGPRRTVEALGRVVLLAHSAAYVPAAFALARGGVDVHEVHLLDALYRERPEFEAWARAHSAEFVPGAPRSRRLTVIYTDREGTGPRSRALLARLAARVPEPDRAARVWNDATLAPPPPEAYARPLFAQRTSVSHEDIPRVFLAQLVETAGLRPTRP